jgi:hypothetical protein
MVIRTTTIVGVTQDGSCSVAWISIADSGDVSVGLKDKNVVMASPGGERAGSRNPHFTFHPPMYHHLRTNREPELLAGLMDVGLMLAEKGLVPWVRLVSRPYGALKPFGETRGKTAVLRFAVPNNQASLLIELDFVRTIPANIEPQYMYTEVAAELALRVAVQSCPPSPASMTLLWEG